jgi:hypothetical protein
MLVLGDSHFVVYAALTETVDQECIVVLKTVDVMNVAMTKSVDQVTNVVLTVRVCHKGNVVRVRSVATTVFAPDLVSHAVVLVLPV